MIGKWNKSVILTYLGLAVVMLGIVLVLHNIDIKYAYICLICAGVCDMFDGTVARRCKRNDEEKAFGIQLDSLADVANFVVFPMILLCKINTIYYILPIMIIYGIFGVARLANFNITAPTDNTPVKYYQGMPVTLSALIFPVIYLLSYVLSRNIFIIIYDSIALLVGILFVAKIKIPKPRIYVSFILLAIAIIVTVTYLVV